MPYLCSRSSCSSKFFTLSITMYRLAQETVAQWFPLYEITILKSNIIQPNDKKSIKYDLKPSTKQVLFTLFSCTFRVLFRHFRALFSPLFKNIHPTSLPQNKLRLNHGRILIKRISTISLRLNSSDNKKKSRHTLCTAGL